MARQLHPEHDLNDRPSASRRSAHRCADKTDLCQRRISHPLRTEFIQ
jgi:hypothetical protein